MKDVCREKKETEERRMERKEEERATQLNGAPFEFLCVEGVSVKMESKSVQRVWKEEFASVLRFSRPLLLLRHGDACLLFPRRMFLGRPNLLPG